MEMFEKNPSGGYRTKGIAKVGDMVNEVPGGRARRPSSVTQINRFCLDFGVSPESFVSAFSAQLIDTTVTIIMIQLHSHLNSMANSEYLKRGSRDKYVLSGCLDRQKPKVINVLFYYSFPIWILSYLTNKTGDKMNTRRDGTRL